jgi:YgiT-type zinc finger domain-containing protein
MDRPQDKEKAVNCPLCRAETEERLITYVQELDGRIVIIENVPAEVCVQCGERLLTPEVVRRIQKLVWDAPVAPKTAEVPVYDLANVA